MDGFNLEPQVRDIGRARAKAAAAPSFMQGAAHSGTPGSPLTAGYGNFCFRYCTAAARSECSSSLEVGPGERPLGTC
jgi:hypothetical protein